MVSIELACPPSGRAGQGRPQAASLEGPLGHNLPKVPRLHGGKEGRGVTGEPGGTQLTTYLTKEGRGVDSIKTYSLTWNPFGKLEEAAREEAGTHLAIFSICGVTGRPAARMRSSISSPAPFLRTRAGARGGGGKSDETRWGWNGGAQQCAEGSPSPCPPCGPPGECWGCWMLLL